MSIRNHKLETIPTLANDLQTIIQLSSESIKFEQCTSDSEEAGKGKEDKENQCKNRHRCDVDLNSLPSGLSENEGSDTSVTGLTSQYIFCSLTGRRISYAPSVYQKHLKNS